MSRMKKDELKQLHQKARLAREAVKTQAYGAALAAIQEGEVRENAEFDEAKTVAVIEKEAGKFKESMEAFAKAGREEQAKELQACMEALIALLPAKLEASAYESIVAKAVAAEKASSMRDMGKVMARLKQDHGTALDARLASEAVKNALS